VTVQTRNHFQKGDVAEVVSPGKTGRSFRIETIRTAEGEDMTVSNTPMRSLIINCPFEIGEGDFIRKKIKQDA